MSVQHQVCPPSASLVWGSSTANFATLLSPFSVSPTLSVIAAELDS